LRSAAYLGVAVLLLLVQSNVHRLTAPLAGLFHVSWPHGLTPSLVLPLIVFLGVHELSTARGALLAFAIGYAEDILGGAPIGLFTFVSVAVWWLARVTGVRLTAQTALPRMSLALAFSLVEGALVLILLAVFGDDNRRPVEIASMVVPHAIATAICSPPVFRLAHRLRQGPLPGKVSEV
jgi:rod shape-determining protein MreD